MSLRPDVEVRDALFFIRDFKLTVDEIVKRYTSSEISKMRDELGLASISGETEEQKAIRVHSKLRHVA